MSQPHRRWEWKHPVGLSTLPMGLLHCQEHSQLSNSCGGCQDPFWPELEGHRCLPGWSEAKGCPVYCLFPADHSDGTKDLASARGCPQQPARRLYMGAGRPRQSVLYESIRVYRVPSWGEAVSELAAAQAEWGQQHPPQVGGRKNPV